jgi:thioredoxin-related protein
MNRLFLFFAIFILLTFCSFRTTLPTDSRLSGTAEPRQIKWLTIQQAYALAQKTPKKFVVDVYTNWCGWCKVMDRQTFTEPAIVDYVNKNYYAVKLNAEQTNDITLGRQTFKYIRGGRRGCSSIGCCTHEQSVELPDDGFHGRKI